MLVIIITLDMIKKYELNARGQFHVGVTQRHTEPSKRLKGSPRGVTNKADSNYMGDN